MKEKLAKEFSKLLREQLPNSDFKKLVRLEKKRSMEGIDTDICHSHDFCDANMVMVEAFENVVGHTPEISAFDTDDMELIQSAWWEAQTNLFYS